MSLYTNGVLLSWSLDAARLMDGVRIIPVILVLGLVVSWICFIDSFGLLSCLWVFSHLRLLLIIVRALAPTHNNFNHCL